MTAKSSVPSSCREERKRRPTKEGKKGGTEQRETEVEAECGVWVIQSVDVIGDSVDGVPLMGDSLRCWEQWWLAQLQDGSAESARRGDLRKRQQKQLVPSF